MNDSFLKKLHKEWEKNERLFAEMDVRIKAGPRQHNFTLGQQIRISGEVTCGMCGKPFAKPVMTISRIDRDGRTVVCVWSSENRCYQSKEQALQTTFGHGRMFLTEELERLSADGHSKFFIPELASDPAQAG